MFQWDKSINAINVSADKVMHLFRSMREVQLALPGVPAQQASAYLCQYLESDGVATAAVFHLHKSNVLAFYCSDPRIVPDQKTDSMLDQGLNFVESMGFLLTDQDIHLLDASDQEMLWESLPLKSGVLEADEPAPAATPKKAAAEPVAKETAEPKIDSEPAAKIVKTAPEAGRKNVETEQVKTVKETREQQDESAENVDDLLAAVEAMRAKRPGLRARKVAPSQDEMNRRKELLRETVGRILASL